MIEITQIRKDYPLPGGGSVTATHVEHMDIGEGDQIAVTGSSGSGKTTFLSVLGGILPATAGSMLWNGKPWGEGGDAGRGAGWRLPARERARRVGFVFQDLNLVPSLTLAENLAAAGYFLGAPVDREGVLLQLGRVGLAGKAGRKPDALSRGERQRAAIARAMLYPHPLVIADEPTASLDEENAALAMELLCAMAKENNSALVVATHDPRVMKRLEKRVELRPAGHREEQA